MYQARNAVGIPYQKFCINSATNHNLCLIWELPPKNTVNKKLRKSSQPWFWQRNSLYWIIWIQSFESCRCLSFVLYLQRPGDIVPDFHSLTKDDNSLLTNQKMGKNRCRSTGWSHTARRPGPGLVEHSVVVLVRVRGEGWMLTVRSVCVDLESVTTCGAAAWPGEHQVKWMTEQLPPLPLSAPIIQPITRTNDECSHGTSYSASINETGDSGRAQRIGQHYLKLFWSPRLSRF